MKSSRSSKCASKPNFKLFCPIYYNFTTDDVLILCRGCFNLCASSGIDLSVYFILFGKQASLRPEMKLCV